MRYIPYFFFKNTAGGGLSTYGRDGSCSWRVSKPPYAILRQFPNWRPPKPTSFKLRHLDNIIHRRGRSANWEKLDRKKYLIIFLE